MLVRSVALLFNENSFGLHFSWQAGNYHLKRKAWLSRGYAVYSSWEFIYVQAHRWACHLITSRSVWFLCIYALVNKLTAESLWSFCYSVKLHRGNEINWKCSYLFFYLFGYKYSITCTSSASGSFMTRIWWIWEWLPTSKIQHMLYY